MDGNGKPDLAVANSNSNTVSVFRNTSISGSFGTGSFAAPQNFPTGKFPSSVVIGDLDGNGKPDLVLANIDSKWSRFTSIRPLVVDLSLVALPLSKILTREHVLNQ